MEITAHSIPGLKGRTSASAYAAVSVILQCSASEKKKKKLTFSTESCVPEAAPTKQIQLSDFFIGKSDVSLRWQEGRKRESRHSCGRTAIITPLFLRSSRGSGEIKDPIAQV